MTLEAVRLTSPSLISKEPVSLTILSSLKRRVGLDLGHDARLDVKHKALRALFELVADKGRRPHPLQVALDTFFDATAVSDEQSNIINISGHALFNRPNVHLVDSGPVGGIGALLDVRAHLVVGDVRRAAVGVVDDADFFQTEKSVEGHDIAESGADIAAGVAVDKHFAGVKIEKGLGDAAGVEAGDDDGAWAGRALGFEVVNVRERLVFGGGSPTALC